MNMGCVSEIIVRTNVVEVSATMHGDACRAGSRVFDRLVYVKPLPRIHQHHGPLHNITQRYRHDMRFVMVTWPRGGLSSKTHSYVWLSCHAMLNLAKARAEREVHSFRHVVDSS